MRVMRMLVTMMVVAVAASACDRPDDESEVGGGLGAGIHSERPESGEWEDGAQPGTARHPGATASAQFIDLDGREVGRVTLEEGGRGVLIRGEITGLTPGAHGFHFHETGLCEPPFASSGSHFAPFQRSHGILHEDGPHAGDLPNIVADANGRAVFEISTTVVTIGRGANGLLDADGTALVVHASADDHRSQPTGNSGDRVACAVVRG
jgi:superoxide dismutase, Cu-Zn family